MKTRDILITVTRTLPGWHVYNDHQFGRITAYDPQARYAAVINLFAMRIGYAESPTAIVSVRPFRRSCRSSAGKRP